MNEKAEGRWLGTSPCDNERTIALRTNALRAYEGKSSELIPPGPRSRVGALESCTHVFRAKLPGISVASFLPYVLIGFMCTNTGRVVLWLLLQTNFFSAVPRPKGETSLVFFLQ